MGLDADYLRVANLGECVCFDSTGKFYTSPYLEPYAELDDSGCYSYEEDPERNRNDY